VKRTVNMVERCDKINGKKGRQIQKRRKIMTMSTGVKNGGYKGYFVFTINVTSLKLDVRQATINGSEGCQ
jgi:hypothetical protein